LYLDQPRGIANSALVSDQLGAWSTCQKRSGYRMGQVNSDGESCLSESNFRSATASRGEQPAANNGRIPGLQRAPRRTERVSRKGVLAEQEELWSNTLNVGFQRLPTGAVRRITSGELLKQRKRCASRQPWIARSGLKPVCFDHAPATPGVKRAESLVGLPANPATTTPGGRSRLKRAARIRF
jgi:hypothetical protein